MQHHEPVAVHTAAGAVEGRRVDGVSSFRGLPYAAPPTGPRRLRPPAAAPTWEGVRPAVDQAVAAVQPPSRGEAVMGPMDVPGYDEDCLTLNVWTPDADESAQLPVLVWFHGGGFMFGAGSASWYDGHAFTRRGEIVVVTVNYRLGALGYLYLPEHVTGEGSTANLGLQDQCAALQWIAENIERFGGDPAKVTIAGQSAGGISVVALHAMPRAHGLFHRAIVWSSGLQLPAHTPERAASIAELYLESAGITGGDAEAVRALSVDQILAAQEQTLLRTAVAVGGDPRLQPASMAPFQLVADGDILPVEPARAARNGSMDAGELLIGINQDEMGFVYAFDEPFWSLDRESVVAQIDTAWGSEGLDTFTRYEAVAPDRSPSQVLFQLLNEEGAVPSIALAERRATAGNPAYLAWFTWQSAAYDGRLGASHTAELPFVFNNFENWQTSPILRDADLEEAQALADQLQDAWISFVRDGVPAEKWPRYVPPERAAMEFGSEIGVLHDPAPNRSTQGLTFRADD